MTTTFFFPSEGTVDISPAPDSTWDYSHRFPRCPLVTTKTYTPFVDHTLLEPVGANPDGRNHIVRQYVSAPLMYQTFAGSVKGHFLSRINSLCAKYAGQLVIKIVDPEGAFVRSLLYKGDLEYNPLKISVADLWTQTLTNRLYPRGGIIPVQLTPGFAQDGDRLVIEVGFRSYATSFVQQSGTIRFGDSGAQNLPLDQTTTELDRNPIVTFAHDVVFA